jgi:hypothetical protein
MISSTPPVFLKKSVAGGLLGYTADYIEDYFAALDAGPLKWRRPSKRAISCVTHG